MVDTSEPKITQIILVTIVLSVALFFMTLVLLWGFKRYTQKLVHDKVELAPAVDLRNMRAYEAETLGSYALVSAERKIVRVPIERAMELEARRPWRLDAHFPAATPTPKINDGGTTHGK